MTILLVRLHDCVFICLCTCPWRCLMMGVDLSPPAPHAPALPPPALPPSLPIRQRAPSLPPHVLNLLFMYRVLICPSMPLFPKHQAAGK